MQLAKRIGATSLLNVGTAAREPWALAEEAASRQALASTNSNLFMAPPSPSTFKRRTDTSGSLAESNDKSMPKRESGRFREHAEPSEKHVSAGARRIR